MDLGGAGVTGQGFQVLALGYACRNGDYGAVSTAVAGDVLGFEHFAGSDWNRTYLLGEVTITFDGTAGGIDLGVSSDWMTVAGGSDVNDTVSFSGGPSLLSRVTGNGLDGAYNDVTWTPEPASMILLALGALVIRRR